MPALAWFLQRGSSARDATDTGMAASGHTVIDIDAADDEPAKTPLAPVPYVLSFADLSYSVNKGGGFAGCCLAPRASSRLVASADAPPPPSGSRRAKTLLDGVSGEACAGELAYKSNAAGVHRFLPMPNWV